MQAWDFLAAFMLCSSFFFNDTATTEIYTLSLHDALPISTDLPPRGDQVQRQLRRGQVEGDRKSTRLNSSHVAISYAVFCLKKKKYHTMSPFLSNKRYIIRYMLTTHPSD